MVATTDAIKGSLEIFAVEVRFLPLTSKSNAGTCPIELSIPISFTKDTVGKKELTFAKLVVEGLKVEERKNLFVIFLIDTTMQDGGKRKEAVIWSHASSLFKRKIKEKRKENQYKIRKIKEKKNKIVSVQVSHNNC